MTVTSGASGTDLRTELRSRGYRLTPQRELVLEAVEALEHATPEQILARVQRTAQGVNLSTVYRTLDLLSELGLVAHTHLGHGAPAYHAASEPEHLHLVCRGCGSVAEAPPSVAGPLVRELRGAYGFEADVPHLTVFGTCAGCRERREATAAGGG